MQTMCLQKKESYFTSKTTTSCNSIIMDLEIIEILHKFGKIFALTPPSSKRKKLNLLQRYYSFLIFALYLVGITIHNYNIVSYHTVLSPTRLTLTIYIFIYNCMVQFYILIIVMGLHRKRWFTLIQNLRNVKIPRNSNTVYLIMLSSSLLTYLSMEFLDSFRLINYFGLYEFALAIPAHFEKLSQFFYTICACAVLKMVLSRYQYHTTMLLHVTNICKHPNPTQLKPALKNLKRTLFVLKRTVEAFNDLFGWTILSAVLCGVTRTLFCLQPLYNQKLKQSLAHDESFLYFVYEIGFTATLWVKFHIIFTKLPNKSFQMGVVSVVLLCDDILKQSNKVLTLTYRLEALANLSLCEYEELEAFIDFVQNNLPRFRIARFFSVDRSILFKMLDSSIAFFLVLLQVYKN
jgi:hypothetical protein